MPRYENFTTTIVERFLIPTTTANPTKSDGAAQCVTIGTGGDATDDVSVKQDGFIMINKMLATLEQYLHDLPIDRFLCADSITTDKTIRLIELAGEVQP